MLGSSYLLGSGGWAMLKHSEKYWLSMEKYWLSMEALSISLVTVVPVLTKAGIDVIFIQYLNSFPELF